MSQTPVNSTRKPSKKLGFRIILGDNFIDYSAACEMSGLNRLEDRRQARLLTFAKKCLQHPHNSRFPPHNENLNQEPHIRSREPFHVNFSHGEIYKKSTIPTCQRLLNNHFTLTV